MRLLIAILAILGLSACDNGADDGIIDVAFIGQPEGAFEQGLRIGPAARLVRASTNQGLVRFNAAGEVVPGLAERWIVADDGKSYIFRISEFDLADGSSLTAGDVRNSLRHTIARLEGTSLGLDLAKIVEIRAMTGQVIEIRLKSPMPGFLQLLAQPELGISDDVAQTGPMSAVRNKDALLLSAMPPEMRGQPAQADWEDGLQKIRYQSLDAKSAARGFARNRFDLMLGGRMEDLPYASSSTFSRAAVRIDPAIGLFGLLVVRQDGFLSSPENREAVALAIDRAGIAEALGIGGWAASAKIIPADLSSKNGAAEQRWPDLSLEQRRNRAAQRVSAWRNANEKAPNITIALPEGPGSDILYRQLKKDLATIGLGLERVKKGNADMVLHDRVARFFDARWFLNQFNCRVSPRACSKDADFLVSLAVDAGGAQESESYLAEAENVLTGSNIYIPLGAPIRWSQTRSGVENFIENIWAFHPLFPLTLAPI